MHTHHLDRSFRSKGSSSSDILRFVCCTGTLCAEICWCPWM